MKNIENFIKALETKINIEGNIELNKELSLFVGKYDNKKEIKILKNNKYLITFENLNWSIDDYKKDSLKYKDILSRDFSSKIDGLNDMIIKIAAGIKDKEKLDAIMSITAKEMIPSIKKKEKFHFLSELGKMYIKQQHKKTITTFQNYSNDISKTINNIHTGDFKLENTPTGYIINKFNQAIKPIVETIYVIPPDKYIHWSIIGNTAKKSSKNLLSDLNTLRDEPEKMGKKVKTSIESLASTYSSISNIANQIKTRLFQHYKGDVYVDTNKLLNYETKIKDLLNI